MDTPFAEKPWDRIDQLRLRACEKFGRRSEGVSGRSRQGAVRENGAILVD
jgi:hypothetical protein